MKPEVAWMIRYVINKETTLLGCSVTKRLNILSHSDFAFDFWVVCTSFKRGHLRFESRPCYFDLVAWIGILKWWLDTVFWFGDLTWYYFITMVLRLPSLVSWPFLMIFYDNKSSWPPPFLFLSSESGARVIYVYRYAHFGPFLYKLSHKK